MSVTLPGDLGGGRLRSMTVAVRDDIRPSTEDEARDRADRIRVGLYEVWQEVQAAWEHRDYLALGYTGWNEYVETEFGMSRIKIPAAERRVAIESMREAGMKIHEIAPAIGMSKWAVEQHPSKPRSTIPRSQGKDDQEPVDAEIVPEPEPVPEPTDPYEDRVGEADMNTGDWSCSNEWTIAEEEWIRERCREILARAETWDAGDRRMAASMLQDLIKRIQHEGNMK